MCGVAGVARGAPRGVPVALLERMAGAIRHRGPDEQGYYADAAVGLANARLVVLDPAGGHQPMTGAGGDTVLVYNGEIFNHADLRRELAARGHRFRTRSDTEVLLVAYAEWGEAMLERLNGQFAFALYDRRERTLLLARDRFGVLPLYYAERGGDLYFASEIKGILASGEVDAALDPDGLDEVFTFWAARPPRTPFRGIAALEPGCRALWRDGRLSVRRYYRMGYPAAAAEPADAIDALDDVLRSAVRLRLVADVPVGAYLSGGLDSSVVCALAAGERAALQTLSVAFTDPRFDESVHQHRVAALVGGRHAEELIRPGDVARVFPDVVRHAETPLVRTAPAPLYLLSQRVRELGLKVVLSGEGADEVFLGYDLFKETVLRGLASRRPDSPVLARRFAQLYPELAPRASGSAGWLRPFAEDASPADPLFSHLPRVRTTSRIKAFYAPDFRAALDPQGPVERLRDAVPAGFAGWRPLARAAWLEMTTFLAPYLLSSQGDRMAMAHGIEVRVPYLDHRVFEYAAALPEGSKLRGLRDKHILRRLAARFLPAAVAERRKQPYAAPEASALLAGPQPEYLAEVLAPEGIARTGVFAPDAVGALVRRCREGRARHVWEQQALVAVVSTALWHREFLEAPAAPGGHPGPAAAPVHLPVEVV